MSIIHLYGMRQYVIRIIVAKSFISLIFSCNFAFILPFLKYFSPFLFYRRYSLIFHLILLLGLVIINRVQAFQPVRRVVRVGLRSTTGNRVSRKASRVRIPCSPPSSKAAISDTDRAAFFYLISCAR